MEVLWMCKEGYMVDLKMDEIREWELGEYGGAYDSSRSRRCDAPIKPFY